jgi:hypothetical protein
MRSRVRRVGLATVGAALLVSALAGAVHVPVGQTHSAEGTRVTVTDNGNKPDTRE